MNISQYRIYPDMDRTFNWGFSSTKYSGYFVHFIRAFTTHANNGEFVRFDGAGTGFTYILSRRPDMMQVAPGYLWFASTEADSYYGWRLRAVDEQELDMFARGGKMNYNYIVRYLLSVIEHSLTCYGSVPDSTAMS